MIRHGKFRIPEHARPRIPVREQLVVALSMLLLVFGFTYIDQIIGLFGTEPKPRAVQPETKTIPAAQPIEAEDPFADVNIRARSAYVWDINEQRALFNKNADVQRPIASVTKLMTALIAYELMESDSNVKITRDAIHQNGDSNLLAGEHFSLENLADFALVTSSNDGAYALATAVGAALTDGSNPTETFVDAMNIKAQEIGLSETFFKNPTGLDISEQKAGAYGSARDMAFLMEYIITKHPAVVELTSARDVHIRSELGTNYLAENTNPTVYRIPNLLASKTGYTELAGGNLVVAFNAGLNRPVIISVLGSTYDARFSDVITLARHAQEYITKQQ